MVSKLSNLSKLDGIGPTQGPRVVSIATPIPEPTHLMNTEKNNAAGGKLPMSLINAPRFTQSELRNNFANTLDQAIQSQVILLTYHDRPRAAIVSISELARLYAIEEKLEDIEDARAAEEARASGDYASLEDAKKELGF